MIIFPGVGSFGQAMQSLQDRGWTEALKNYILSNRPFFGICLGMQSLFEGSEETPGTTQKRPFLQLFIFFFILKTQV